MSALVQQRPSNEPVVPKILHLHPRQFSMDMLILKSVRIMENERIQQMNIWLSPAPAAIALLSQSLIKANSLMVSEQGFEMQGINLCSATRFSRKAPLAKSPCSYSPHRNSAKSRRPVQPASNMAPAFKKEDTPRSVSSFCRRFSICPASAGGYPDQKTAGPGTPPPAGTGPPGRSAGPVPAQSGWWRAPSFAGRSAGH